MASPSMTRASTTRSSPTGARGCASSDRPERIFEAVREVIEATGVLKGKTRRALDSTLLDDAVATQDTVTQLVSAIRRVRRVVPGARGSPSWPTTTTLRANPSSPGTTKWPEANSSTHWSTTPSRCSTRCADVAEPESAAAIGLLALVAGQDVEHGDDGRWRIARGVAKDRVISIVDPEARHMHKCRSEYRDGYKAHLAIEPETGLVTAAALTPANAPDGPNGVKLLEGEAPGLQVLADGAYGSGPTLAALTARDTNARSSLFPTHVGIEGAFTATTSPSTTRHGTATCPAGHVVTLTARNNAVFAQRCASCPFVIAAPFEEGPHAAPHRSRRATRRVASRLARRRPHFGLSKISTHGRTIDRLARDGPLPTSQIPRRREEPTRPLHSSRRDQPATSDQSRANPRRDLGVATDLT